MASNNKSKLKTIHEQHVDRDIAKNVLRCYNGYTQLRYKVLMD